MVSTENNNEKLINRFYNEFLMSITRGEHTHILESIFDDVIRVEKNISNGEKKYVMCNITFNNTQHLIEYLQKPHINLVPLASILDKDCILVKFKPLELPRSDYDNTLTWELCVENYSKKFVMNCPFNNKN